MSSLEMWLKNHFCFKMRVVCMIAHCSRCIFFFFFVKREKCMNTIADRQHIFVTVRALRLEHTRETVWSHRGWVEVVARESERVRQKERERMRSRMKRSVMLHRHTLRVLANESFQRMTDKLKSSPFNFSGQASNWSFWFGDSCVQRDNRMTS